MSSVRSCLHFKLSAALTSVKSPSAHLTSLPLVRFLVLDEADRMVESGHFKELDSLLGLLAPAVKRQTFVLSATLTAQHRNFVPVSTILPRGLCDEHFSNNSTSLFVAVSTFWFASVRVILTALGALIKRIDFMRPREIVDLTGGKTAVVQTLTEARIVTLADDKVPQAP